MLTERTQHIKSELMASTRRISLERALLYKESYRRTEGETPCDSVAPRPSATCSRSTRS